MSFHHNNNATENDPLQTGWKNPPTLKKLKADKKGASKAHDAQLAKLEFYKETLDGGKELPRNKINRKRSRAKTLLVRQQYEWRIPAMEEPFLSSRKMFTAKPRSGEDGPNAKQTELVLNYYWDVKVGKIALVGDAIRTFVPEGTVIIKTGWHSDMQTVDVEKEEPVYGTPEESLAMLQQMVQQGAVNEQQAQAIMMSGKPIPIGKKKVIVQEERLTENHPIYEVKDTSMITIDPTCEGNIKKAKFLIDSYYTDYATLKAEEYVEHEDEETGEITMRGVYRNLDKIKIEEQDVDASERRILTNNNISEFKFEDKPRMKVLAHDYWGYWDIDGTGEVKPIVATWVGDQMIRLEENPFPHQRIPFSLAKFMPVKNEIYGEPDGAILRGKQDGLDAMTRAVYDVTSNQAVGQKIINKNLLMNQADWDSYVAGEDVQSNPTIDPKQAIYKENVEPISPSIFQFIQMVETQAENLTGKISFNGGKGGSALGASATHVRSALDASSQRELSILRRLSAMFQDMAEMTVENMQLFAREEEVIRITGSDEFVSVKREDIQGNYDLIVDITTPQKNNESAESLAFMLQASGEEAFNDPIKREMMAQWADLKEHPDLAKFIREYKPEPDPGQVALQQQQLENARLENEKIKMEMIKIGQDIKGIDSIINERDSRSSENHADYEMKMSKARLSQAQADKLESERDKLDMDMVNEAEGVTDQRREEDRNHEIEKLAMSEHNKLTQARLKHDSESDKISAQKILKRNGVQ